MSDISDHSDGSNNDPEVRLFIVSDLHVENRENLRWIEQLSDTAYQRDALIVAGDVNDEMSALEQALRLLKCKFCNVLFAPGNHDLWLTPEDYELGLRDSISKIKAIISRCEENHIDVRMTRIGSRTSGVRVCPLLAWHHQSFDTEPDLQGFDIPPVEQCMTDFRSCHFAPPLDPRTDSVARAIDALNDELNIVAPRATTEGSAAAVEPLVTFSHFLPRVELLPEKRFLMLPVLAKASGSSFLRARVEKMQSTVHVFGHTHFGWCRQQRLNPPGLASLPVANRVL